MKILSLNNYHYLRGGSEQVYFSEMALLQAHGHEVFSFARKTDKDIPSDYSNLFPHDMRTDKLHFSFGGFRILREVIYSSESKKQLDKMLKEISPDVVHAHNIYGRLTTSVLDLMNKKNMPVVMTLHDYKLICPSYLLMSDNQICENCKGGKYYNAILKKCHKNSIVASAIYAFESWINNIFKKYKNNVCFFIAPSQFLRNKLIEFRWPAEQIVYIPNYIVSQDFIPNYEPKNNLLYIGRLSAEKGISTLIKAFKKVDKQNLQLIIVGDGPEKERLEEMSKKDNRIQFTGYLSGRKLGEVTRNAGAVVVPSVCYDNAPISILEAFAYGKLVIGARIGGIPEMIDDGKNGFLFEPGNEDDLSNIISNFLNLSQENIIKMGKNARKKVEKQYSPEIHYEKLINVYRDAIEVNKI